MAKARAVQNDDVTLADLAKEAKLRPGDYCEVRFDNLGLWNMAIVRATPALRRMMRARPALRRVPPDLRCVCMTESDEMLKEAAQGPEWTYEETYDPPVTDCAHCRAKVYWYNALGTEEGYWRSNEQDCTSPTGHEPL
jgi:hypothetical protein